MNRPVIGIATQTQDAVPGILPRVWIMSQRYVQVLSSLGAVPWLVPLLPGDQDTLRAIYDRLDGVFLTGGMDVDPSLYGEERHPKCGQTDRDRDAVEMTFVRWALEDHKPLLAVCRGFQMLNVACGGSLFQDVGAQYPAGIKHDYFPTAAGTPTRDYLAHDIRVEPQSRLGRYLGAETVRVNSMHHQGIKALAPTLVPSAWAPDGLIEGVEGSNGHYVVAVQWHPEELTAQEGQRRLFTEFLAAAGT
jgi:putative glutamine amidotransferase